MKPNLTKNLSSYRHAIAALNRWKGAKGKVLSYQLSLSRMSIWLTFEENVGTPKEYLHLQLDGCTHYYGPLVWENSEFNLSLTNEGSELKIQCKISGVSCICGHLITHDHRKKIDK